VDNLRFTNFFWQIGRGLRRVSIILVPALLMACVLTTVAFAQCPNEFTIGGEGVWTAVETDAPEYVEGLNTNEVRWGNPADSGKSGLRFVGSGSQTVGIGEDFAVGTLTHINMPVYYGATGATLDITLHFTNPALPDQTFTFDFDIEETWNRPGYCPDWQQSTTPCDDRVTFPDPIAKETFEIDGVFYTLQIAGFMDAYPNGSLVEEFITEEGQNNCAFLVGRILVAAPDITPVSAGAPIWTQTTDTDFDSGTFTNTEKVGTGHGADVRLKEVIQNWSFEDTTGWTYSEEPDPTDAFEGKTDGWCKTDGDNGYGLKGKKDKTVSVGDYGQIAQTVDLTGVNTITFDAKVEIKCSGETGKEAQSTAYVLIGTNVVWSAGPGTDATYTDATTSSLSAYSGTHTLIFQLKCTYSPGDNDVFKEDQKFCVDKIRPHYVPGTFESQASLTSGAPYRIKCSGSKVFTEKCKIRDEMIPSGGGC